MNPNQRQHQDIAFDLHIARMDRRTDGGVWVDGTVAGHRFNALVFQAPAECPEWELNGSRISKLWLKRIADQRIVFNWDRGADLPAADATASAIVAFLTAGLADHVFPG